VLREARCEIEHAERPVRAAKRGFEYIGVVEIALNAWLPSATEEKRPPSRSSSSVEKHRLGVEAWQATPPTARVFDQRGELAVADQTEIFEPHAAAAQQIQACD
jgi:hypothetical protein